MGERERSGFMALATEGTHEIPRVKRFDIQRTTYARCRIILGIAWNHETKCSVNGRRTVKK